MGSGADTRVGERLKRSLGEPCGRCERRDGECTKKLYDICKYGIEIER